MADKVKSWFASNWMMLLSGALMIGMNYGILTAAVNSKVDAEAARDIADKEIREIVKPKLTEQENLINQILSKDLSDTKIQLEIKFNLKRLMKSQGVDYIENTDK